MTDPTTPGGPTPAPAPDELDPVTITPLLTPRGFDVCDKFSTDLAALCDAASQAGMTANMLSGALQTMLFMIGQQMLDNVNVGNIPAAPVPTAAPPAPAPAPAVPTETALVLVNGISTTTLSAGDDVTLTLGPVTTPGTDMQMISLSLDSSAAPLTSPAVYSLELEYKASNGAPSYTVNALWPGITLYGKEGDKMRLSIGSDNTVSAHISQDSGVSWTAFFMYAPPAADPLYVHLVASAFASAASVVKS
jgi:hypothetical protein